MSEFITPFAEWAAATIELLGIGLITLAACYAIYFAVIQRLRGQTIADNFHTIRQHLGRGILFGLEFLVAADIIHTVAVELTFTTVGVLAIIVLIRTFLSFTLNLELTGRWPWQEAAPAVQQNEVKANQ
ncbi:MAG: DUF1622 domain-containing protein [Caldilineaceae bacterium]